MKILRALAVSLILLVQIAAAQSLADLARQERERKAKEQRTGVNITTDEVKAGKVEVSPSLDPARKGDLDYLLQQLSHPSVTPDLLAAFIPLKDRAIPRLLQLLGSTDPLKRVAPATVLIVLGNTDGVGSMARLLDDSMETAASAAASAAPSPAATGAPASGSDAFSRQMEATRESNYALAASRLGIWRFTDGSELPPDQVVQRLKGPGIEIVGGPDNGQKIFNRALRDKDANLQQGAIALIRAASGGQDFGFQPGQPPEQNESAIQQITTFLTTERAKVISQLGTKPQAQGQASNEITLQGAGGAGQSAPPSFRRYDATGRAKVISQLGAKPRPELTPSASAARVEGAATGFKREMLPSGDMTVLVPVQTSEDERTSNVVHLHAALDTLRAVVVISMAEVNVGQVSSPDTAFDGVVKGLQAKAGFQVLQSEKKSINGEPGMVVKLQIEAEGRTFQELQANVISGGKGFAATCGSVPADFPKVESLCRTVVESITLR